MRKNSGIHRRGPFFRLRGRNFERLEDRALLHGGVVSLAPFNGESNVDTSAEVEAVFNFDADPATVTSSTFELLDPQGQPIPATISYDIATRTATLTPTSSLPDVGDYYSATLVGGPSGIKDAGTGEPIDEDITWHFITETPTYQDTVIFSGFNQPTNVEFASDGRVFVAEKRGVIKVFDDLTDPTPDIFADLRTNVHNHWDRGLLGMALHPDFPNTSELYVLYTYDAPLRDTSLPPGSQDLPPAPYWGEPDVNSDPGPGTTGEGPSVSGRLSRLHVGPDNSWDAVEHVLVHDWGQQYPSHSVGDITFGSDGSLYASGGDGASFNFQDFGQNDDLLGSTALNDPVDQGGSLRSQDLRSRDLGVPDPDDPVSLDGTIIRVDAALLTEGQPLPDNPLFGDADPNAERIVAYGMRNPFRLTTRPGTNEVWAGDVGQSSWEEINVIRDPTSSLVHNFGWPAYEGDDPFGSFDSLDLPLLENLYSDPDPDAHIEPFLPYEHGEVVFPGTTVPSGNGSSISGLAFSEGGNMPPAYDGALFFSDFTRDGIYVMFKGIDGDPNIVSGAEVLSDAENPVALKIGPEGDLFYVDIIGGAIRRVRFEGIDKPPVAVAQSDVTSGAVPLTVNFDATASSDPDPGDTLTFDWDLDGDGQLETFDDPQPSYTYTSSGLVTVTLQVTDSTLLTDTDTIDISAGNTPPTAVIDSPTGDLIWQVGDTISFSGHADDVDEPGGTLPASSLDWEIILHHCPGGQCHTHFISSFTGTAGDSFTAPDHEYPSHLEIKLTATDPVTSVQDTDSVLIFPQTVDLTFDSVPAGLDIAVNILTKVTPFDFTVIVGSDNLITAPSPQTSGETMYVFDSWSDGGAQSHNIIAGTQPETFTATYLPQDTSSGPQVQTGVVPGVDNSTWTTVTLGESYTSMVVIATPNYDATSVALVPRIQNASENSFQVRVDRTDGSTATVPAIDVHYLVVEEGVYNQAEHGVTMEAVKIQSTVTDHRGAWIGENRGYTNSYTSPAVMGQVMTYNDPNFSVFWSHDGNVTDPPSASTLFVGKHVGEDPNTTRAQETIGYVVIESGSGVMEGLEYTADVGADTVKGIDQSSGYSYPISGPSSPTSAVVSQVAMNGGNGGWAVLFGVDPVSASNLQLAIEEDQAADAERFHTTEQVAYLVLGPAAGDNNPPTATDDSGVGFITDEDTPFTTASVLSNDTDPDAGDVLSVVSVNTTATQGLVTDNGDGTFLYNPNGQFEGLAVGQSTSDSFIYTVSDGNGGTDTATVTITVDGVNDAPTAADDSGEGFITDEDTPFTTANVLSNDTDPDAGDVLSVVSVDTAATQGLVTDNGDGTFLYDPNGQFEGLAAGQSTSDSFIYTVSDGNGGTDTATVTITVDGVNDVPTAADDSGEGFITDEDTPFTTANVLSNDTDPDAGDVLSVVSVDTAATQGLVTDNGDGTFQYTPPTDYSGFDSFSYTVSDGQGGVDTADVTITINSQGAPIRLQTGVVPGVDNSAWTTVTLGESYTSMVVIATPNYDATSVALVSRIQNASGNSFQVRVDRTDGSTATVPAIDVHYLVVEEGVYNQAEHGVTMEAVKIQSTVTDHRGAWIGENRGYTNSYTSPAVMGQVMTYNDPNFSVFWSHDGNVTDPPSASALFVGKHVGEDPNTTRAQETIGYVVIESGSGVMEGLEYTADVGADTVKGIDQSSGYSYPISGPSSPTSAVVSQVAMNGGNGGWAVLFGVDPVSASNLQLAIEEDQAADAERFHTTEQVAYLVLGTPTATPASSLFQETLSSTVSPTAPWDLMFDPLTDASETKVIGDDLGRTGEASSVDADLVDVAVASLVHAPMIGVPGFLGITPLRSLVDPLLTRGSGGLKTDLETVVDIVVAARMAS